MSLIPFLLLSLIAVAFYGAFFKLAAFIFKRTTLSWTNGFLFGLLLFLILVSVKALTSFAAGLLADGAASAAGLCAGILAGSWFFKSRARSRNGEAIGWKGGFMLTLIGFSLLVAAGLALIFLTQLVRHS